jgi:predicted HicB family RNase H-like nuclease
MGRKLETVELDLPTDVYEALMRVAKMSGVSLNTVVRVLLATYVVSHGAENKQ